MRDPNFEHSVQVNPKPKSTTVKAGHGFAFVVKKGEHFKITDTHGRQIVDLTGWALKSDGEMIQKHHHFSADHTRWQLQGATPVVGEYLYANTGSPMFKVLEDTVKVHDMTFACCYPELYASLGSPGHRSCSQNIAEAMAPWGIESHLEVKGPFNCFQNTPFYSLKGGLMSSRSGDYIEFKAMMDCVVAVSSCPWDREGFGEPTDIAVSVG